MRSEIVGGDREVLGRQLVAVAIVGVQVHAAVVHPGPDLALVQPVEQLVAAQRSVGLDQHLVEVASVTGAGLAGGAGVGSGRPASSSS